ncbi:MAG: cupin domain-containing protein [Rhodospirillales bacterium]|nr:cupin domain-containing protein [Rhodospirillales bacterium]
MASKYLFHPGEGRDEPIKDLEGASRLILIDGQEVAAEDVTFGFSRFAPHTSIHKKHTHPEAEEIMYILKGRGISGVSGEEFEVNAGDTLWIPRGEVHWFYNPFDDACEFVFIYTRPSLASAGYQLAGG